MSTTGNSLYPHIRWLWGVVAVDAVALTAIASSSAIAQDTIKHYMWIRGFVTATAPVVVLLLTSLISSKAYPSASGAA